MVGDTHGQFHDVCNMLELMGTPSEPRKYVFNGDFVDRGAWGVETLALLCCWKLALPGSVYMLRGNHETATCTLMYGFKGELVAKYGRGASAWKVRGAPLVAKRRAGNE
jgi:serine/threonine-protein phosphatase 5